MTKTCQYNLNVLREGTCSPRAHCDQQEAPCRHWRPHRHGEVGGLCSVTQWGEEKLGAAQQPQRQPSPSPALANRPRPCPGSKASWEVGPVSPQGVCPEHAFLSEGADPRPRCERPPTSNLRFSGAAFGFRSLSFCGHLFFLISAKQQNLPF